MFKTILSILLVIQTQCFDFLALEKSITDFFKSNDDKPNDDEPINDDNEMLPQISWDDNIDYFKPNDDE